MEGKSLLGPEHSLGLGLGLRVPSRHGSKTSTSSAGSVSRDFTDDNVFQVATKGAMKRFLGPLSSKPMAYLSAFILYIATVGDIVDGVDTTHDFNFFTLIYERPNDVRPSEHFLPHLQRAFHYEFWRCYDILKAFDFVN